MVHDSFTKAKEFHPDSYRDEIPLRNRSTPWPGSVKDDSVKVRFDKISLTK